MSVSIDHIRHIGTNCFLRGCDEQQADNVISQFANVLPCRAWDAFWDGYYTAVQKQDLDGPPLDMDDIRVINNAWESELV